jgi:hypothetical protein
MRVDTETTDAKGLRPMNLSWHERNRAALVLKRRVARAFREAGRNDIARRLDMCGEWEQLVACGECGGYWWTRYRCKLRCCPVCSKDKARDRAAYLLAVANEQTQCKMITLTMRRWRGDTREGIKVLRQAIQRFRDTKIMAKCKGGAYTIELIPKPDGWHIHAHMIVDVPYIPFRVLVRAWAHALRQPSPHVRIQNASAAAVKKYICKYASKSMIAEVGAANIVAWFDAIQGSRLWATFGHWYNATLEEMSGGFFEPPQPPPCPHCGTRGRVFCARAGPAIFGRDWRHFAHGDLLTSDYERPCKPVIDYVTASEAPQNG